MSEDKHVSKEVLHPLCEYEWVQEWVKVIDYSVYQMLIDIVMPDVLHPIPGKVYKNTELTFNQKLSVAEGCTKLIQSNTQRLSITLSLNRFLDTDDS